MYIFIYVIITCFIAHQRLYITCSSISKVFIHKPNIILKHIAQRLFSYKLSTRKFIDNNSNTDLTYFYLKVSKVYHFYINIMFI